MLMFVMLIDIETMPNLIARFQPYTLSMYDSHSHNSFSTRQLVTLPSFRRKIMFMIFLRRKCSARRRGNWARVPGNSLITKAMDYATRHGGYVYDLRVKSVPIPRRHRAGDDSDSDDSGDSVEENVPEEDILSGDEHL